MSLIVTLLGVGQAHAAVMDFNFSYTYADGQTLTGVLRGDLQADNNTIVVTAIPESVYSGNTSLTFTGPIFDNPLTPEVEQNTAYLSPNANNSFGFTPPAYNGGTPAWVIGLPLGSGYVAVSDTPGFSFVFESFVPSNLSITAVPAPAAVWLLATGLAGIGLRKWRHTRLIPA